jgi:hypothetical protein
MMGGRRRRKNGLASNLSWYCSSTLLILLTMNRTRPTKKPMNRKAILSGINRTLNLIMRCTRIVLTPV